MKSSDSKTIEELTDIASRNHSKISKEISGALFDIIMKVYIKTY
jgi:hypothetical protein